MGRMEALLQPGRADDLQRFPSIPEGGGRTGLPNARHGLFFHRDCGGGNGPRPGEIRAGFPKCRLRRYTLSEIINAVPEAGLLIRRFDEHPAWTDSRLPGEFTLLADKP